MQSLNEITKNVEKVISYSQSLNNVNAAPLINQWYEAKKEFIDLFGGECTYTYPEKVSFEIDEKTKRIEVDEFIVEVESHWNNDRLADFIYDMKDSFYSNTVSKDYVIDNETIITKGTKLIKAFKYFVENAHDLKEIQDAASRIIQKDKVEGYLTLSVHPLDYLSASENAHNWRSCHALDGDYRAGNLNYMVDDSTIICYLSSGKEEKLPSFPEDVRWNSKKWRVWLFLSNDREMMFAGRQYPFFTEVGLNMITNTIFPRFNGRYHWSCWHDEYVTAYSRKNNYIHALAYKYVPVGGRLISMRDLIHENENNLFYNDLLESSTYTTPFYCYNANYGWIYDDWGDTSEDTRFDIGADALCPVCGKHVLTHTYLMVCDDCEEEAGNAVYCQVCDRRIPEGEEIVFSGWKILCPECAKKFSAFCSKCGCFDLKENLYYNVETDEFLCEDCYHEYVEEED